MTGFGETPKIITDFPEHSSLEENPGKDQSEGIVLKNKLEILVGKVLEKVDINNDGYVTLSFKGGESIDLDIEDPETGNMNFHKIQPRDSKGNSMK